MNTSLMLKHNCLNFLIRMSMFPQRQPGFKWLKAHTAGNFKRLGRACKGAMSTWLLHKEPMSWEPVVAIDVAFTEQGLTTLGREGC